MRRFGLYNIFKLPPPVTLADVSSKAVNLLLFIHCLSYDVASGSGITPCNKICKPLVVYRFLGNVMTSITTLRT